MMIREKIENTYPCTARCVASRFMGDNCIRRLVILRIIVRHFAFLLFSIAHFQQSITLLLNSRELFLLLFVGVDGIENKRQMDRLRTAHKKSKKNSHKNV